MRIVYVAGFFNPVRVALQDRCGEDIQVGAVVWIPQLPNGVVDLKRLKELIFDGVARQADEILILAFVLHGKQYHYVHDVLEGVRYEAIQRLPTLKISVEVFKNARDSDGVVERISSFGPENKKKGPDTLEKLDLWVKSELPDRLIIHPRAIRGANKSRFEDVGLVFDALSLLGREYRDMRLASGDDAAKSRQRYTARLGELGLELAPSISPSRAGEQGEEYYIQYPVGNGTRRLLDLHLKKGSDREERFCLRIYFFWDDDARCPVVGWLPSHLDTRST